MLETNADASCYPDYASDASQCPGRASEILWMKVANIVLQVIYSVECILRAFVEREHYVPCLRKTSFHIVFHFCFYSGRLQLETVHLRFGTSGINLIW